MGGACKTYIFPADLPPRLRLIQLLRNLVPTIPKAYNHIALDCPQTTHLWRPARVRHRPDGLVERRARGRSAVVRQLTVVQVALENDEVRAREVQEEVGRLRMQLPECIARAPEGVLFVHPFTFRFVLLQQPGRELTAANSRSMRTHLPPAAKSLQ